jgi:hypothetical protein
MKTTFPLYGAEENEVDRMAVYIAACFGKYFLESSLTAAAPSHDFQFFPPF